MNEYLSSYFAFYVYSMYHNTICIQVPDILSNLQCIFNQCLSFYGFAVGKIPVHDKCTLG